MIHRSRRGIHDAVNIPHEMLSPEVLRRVIEEFVTREGTEYGDHDVTLDDKVAQVMAQLKRGEAKIAYDDESNSVSLVPAR